MEISPIFIGHEYHWHAESKKWGNYCICNHIYMILEGVQLRNAIASAYSHSLSTAAKDYQAKAKGESIAIVPDTERSRGETHHHVQTSGIFADNEIKNYIRILISLFKVYTFSNRQDSSFRFRTTRCCHSCFHTIGPKTAEKSRYSNIYKLSKPIFPSN